MILLNSSSLSGTSILGGPCLAGLSLPTGALNAGLNARSLNAFGGFLKLSPGFFSIEQPLHLVWLATKLLTLLRKISRISFRSMSPQCYKELLGGFVSP